MEILEICRGKLFDICNPYDVTERSKEFQARMKKKLGLPDSYMQERSIGYVPHPEYILIDTL